MNPDSPIQQPTTGFLDRLTGRPSLYGVLRAAESPDAESYQADFALADQGLSDARAAVERREIPPPLDTDRFDTVLFTRREFREIRRLAAQHRMSVDELLTTLVAGFFKNLPDPPKGWKQKAPDKPGPN